MRTLIATVVLVFAAALAHEADAGTFEEQVALGWQTEHADLVVVATCERTESSGAERPAESRWSVEETLRGHEPGASVAVRGDLVGESVPWSAGMHCILFLRRCEPAPGGPARFTLLCGAQSLRKTGPAEPESRFPGIVRAIAASIDAMGVVRDPASLREQLVAWAEDRDPGVAWSAATDLVRHEELHEGLSVQQRGRLVRAFAHQPCGRMTKRALAFAAAAAGGEEARRALVDAVCREEATSVRPALAEALRRLGGDATGRLLAERLDGASAAARLNLLVAIGAVGGAEQVTPIRGELGGEDAIVRSVAAHSLGLVAQRVREKDAESRVAGVVELTAMLRDARADDEAKAALWALAQMDEPAAWDELRRARHEDHRERVRAWAAEYLERPRQPLILR